MKKYIYLSVGLTLFLGAILTYLIYTGTIWRNTPSSKKYPIRGIDVSHYQGDIN